MRKAKIVATIGPASIDQQTLKNLVDSGMDVARQNFSHGTHEQHAHIIKRIRNLSNRVASMIDTKGPEIRVKQVEQDTVLEQDDRVTLTEKDTIGNSDTIPINYPELLNHLQEGDHILIDDGEIELEVLEVNDTAHCRVIYGGPLTTGRSVNVPGRDIGLKAPTEQDLEDLKFAIEHDFDFVSASFIKQAEEVEEIRELLNQHDSDMQIIAKIEHLTALENLDEILQKADGIMVARGDLGVEINAARVPVLQKEIIRKCNKAGKPVITATQMLKSMTEHPRATRAETSDVANAIIDGTDAVMLSEETAVGKYPVKSLQYMAEIIENVEQSEEDDIHHTVRIPTQNIADIICKNVWQASRDMDVKYTVAHTSSGYTARNIAKYRPKTGIIAFTSDYQVKRQLGLVWGVEAHYTEFADHVDEMICRSAHHLHKDGKVEPDDILVLSAGVPTSVSGTTNMMEIRDVQSLLQEKEEIEQK